MNEPGLGTARDTVPVCATATITGGFDSANDLEPALLEATRRAGRLLALQQLLGQPTAWIAWWKSNPQFHLKPNPP